MKRQVFSVQEALIDISTISELMRLSAVFEVVGLRIDDLLNNRRLSDNSDLKYRFGKLFSFLEIEYQNTLFIVSDIITEKDELSIIDINNYLAMLVENQRLIIEYSVIITQYISLLDDNLAYLWEDRIDEVLNNTKTEIKLNNKIVENNDLIIKMKRKEI